MAASPRARSSPKESLRVIGPAIIKKARIRKRWSQADLAALCDRAKQSVQKIEAGEQDRIAPDFAAALTDELGLDFDAVFAPADATSSRTKVA